MVAPGHRLAVHGELTIHSVQQLIDPLVVPEPGRDAGQSVVLDLGAVRFVTPAPIVMLASVLSGLPSTGGEAGAQSRLVLVAPKSPDCRRYLAAAGLVQMLAPIVEVLGAEELLALPPSSGVDTVLPLTRLTVSAEIADLLQALEQRLDDMLGGGDDSWDRTKRPILSTIRELCENVFQHAGGAPGWIAAQRYRNRYSGTRYVEVAIGDAGRGIRRSLVPRHTGLLRVTDAEAIERMLVERLTRHPSAYHGTGYFVLQRATKELDGSFYLRSGTGAVQRPRRGALQRSDGLAPWPGTQLQIRLTCA